MYKNHIEQEQQTASLDTINTNDSLSNGPDKVTLNEPENDSIQEKETLEKEKQSLEELLKKIK